METARKQQIVYQFLLEYMEQFRQRKFSECISVYNKLIDEADQDIDPTRLATLYCNKAMAEKGTPCTSLHKCII